MKEAPTLRRCKKHVYNGKGKTCLLKVKSAHNERLVSFLFLKKWRNYPYINSKRLKTFSFISHSLFITKLTLLKKKKSHSLGEFGKKLKALRIDTPRCALEVGAMRRWTALRVGELRCAQDKVHETHPNFPQIKIFFFQTQSNWFLRLRNKYIISLYFCFPIFIPCW